jgi:glycine betaine/proline transport system ATP-binding protein
MTAIEFHGVDIVFGPATKRALEMVDNGATRDEILALTGSVLGAAGIDLSVAKGEICVLMGLSGSGKSTILRAVNRLNPVTRGSVLVEHDGAKVDIARCDDATLREVRRRTVSTVFQQFALLPWRTVRDNVGFGLELRGVKPAERNAIIDEKLAMVGLTNWANKKPHELSGGMQQRIGLARAFATDADILLMDEPFSALDPLIRDKLQDELLELQHRLKKTILFVSHDLDEALKLGDSIVILEGGRIVQKGSAEDIYLRPADAYVAEFVKHINPLNVLSLGALMRPVTSLAREDRTLVCGRDNQIRVTLDDLGRPVGISVGGEQGQLVACRDDQEPSDIGPVGVLVVSDETELRRAIAWKRLNHHPILGIGPAGELTGICGDGEIYLGLMRRGSA